mmetsp:Transcript_4892/g.12588  ORF Transcript_4892/g.12588 Transcript_4892/m.12588 type:complete len:334 (+) Transcript_4892:694-1695(+)
MVGGVPQHLQDDHRVRAFRNRRSDPQARMAGRNLGFFHRFVHRRRPFSADPVEFPTDQVDRNDESPSALRKRNRREIQRQREPKKPAGRKAVRRRQPEPFGGMLPLAPSASPHFGIVPRRSPPGDRRKTRRTVLVDSQPGGTGDGRNRLPRHGLAHPGMDADRRDLDAAARMGNHPGILRHAGRPGSRTETHHAGSAATRSGRLLDGRRGQGANGNHQDRAQVSAAAHRILLPPGAGGPDHLLVYEQLLHPLAGSDRPQVLRGKPAGNRAAGILGPTGGRRKRDVAGGTTKGGQGGNRQGSVDRGMDRQRQVPYLGGAGRIGIRPSATKLRAV